MQAVQLQQQQQEVPMAVPLAVSVDL